MDSPARHDTRSTPTDTVVVQLCALLAAFVVSSALGLPGGQKLICPGCGVYAALLIQRRSARAWYLLPPTAVVAHLFAAELLNAPVASQLLSAVKNIAEGSLIVLITEWLCGTRIAFMKLRELVSFVIAAVTTSAIISFIISIVPSSSIPLLSGASIDCLLGVLVLTPCLVTAQWTAIVSAVQRRLLEMGLLFVVLSGGSFLILSKTAAGSISAFLYLLFPVAIWAGLRFGTFGASCAAVVVSAVAAIETSHGHGPAFFFPNTDLDLRVFNLQLFLSTMTLSSLVLGTSVQERKRFGAALAESEERFRLATVGTNDGLWDWNISANLLYLSARASELLGFGAQELTLTRAEVLDRIHPHDVGMVRSAARAHLVRAEPYDVTCRIKTKKNVYRWFRTRGTAPPQRDTLPVRIVGSFADITNELTRRGVLEFIASGVGLDKILSAIAEQLQGQLAGGQVAILLLDSKSSKIHIGATHGISRELIEELQTVTIGPRVGCWGSAIYGNRRIIVEDTENHPQWESVTSLLKEHHVRATWAEPIRNEQGTCIGAIAIYHPAPRAPTIDEIQMLEDLAALSAIAIGRAQSSAELKERGEDFERVLTSLSAITYRASLDPKQPLVFARGGCQELMGYSSAELTQRLDLNFIALVAPEDRTRFEGKFKHFRSSRIQHTLEYRILTKNGGIKWVLDQARAVFSDNGSVLGIEGLLTDITARKSIEEKHQSLEEQLAQSHKMEALGTLAGGIAHDFNNILGAVIGFAELAKRKSAEGESPSGDLDHVLAAALRARNLVGQILTFSRKESSEYHPLSLATVVDEILSFLRATLPSSITLRVALDRAAPLIRGNPTQLHQVLLNLVTNAADSIGNNRGTIEISLSQTVISSLQKNTLPELRDGPYITLTVRDSGPGISESIIPRIFDPFFTTKAPGKGTGLGLSVVHGITKSHGGTVRVESPPQGGACFTVYFPCINELLLAEGHQSPLPALGRGERVMFVDDEQALVHLAKEILIELNYTVDGFTSSSAACDAFEKNPDSYDLVITDKTMPGMTGLELLVKIKALRPGLPVVLITGLLGEEATKIEQNRERIAILLKPYTTEVLATTIRALIDGRALPPQAIEEQMH